MSSSETPNSIITNKNLLREKIKLIRSQITPGMAESASQMVCSTFISLPEFKKAKGIAAFASTPHEINTFPLLETCLEMGKKLYLPRTTKDKNQFDYYPISSLDKLQTGPFGIPEPIGGHPTNLSELDLILVPGLAFDRIGNRLGYGKGYYDQVLPRLKTSSLTIGLAYTFQILNQVPVSEMDVPVMALLTEKEFQYCSK